MTDLPRPRGDPNPDLQVRLAAERTLLAWIRTGVALMGFGFVVARLGLFLREMAGMHDPERPSRPGLSLGMGMFLILFGVIVNGVAAWRHRLFMARLDRGLFPLLSTGWMGVVVSAVLGLLGVSLAIYWLSLGR